MKSSPHLRLGTALYGTLLLLIIVAADQGHLPVGRWLRHIPWGDKVGHFLLMGGLAFLLNLSLGLRHWRGPGCKILLGSTVVALVAGLEELSQLWLTHRRFDLWDLTADLAGILVFDGLARFFGSRAELQKPSLPLES